MCIYDRVYNKVTPKYMIWCGCHFFNVVFFRVSLGMFNGNLNQLRGLPLADLKSPVHYTSYFNYVLLLLDLVSSCYNL